MKKLYEVKIKEKIVDVSINEKSTDTPVIFTTESGNKIKIDSYHSQDCCEHVYADFGILKYVVDEIKKETIEDLYFIGVEGMGFLMCFNEGYTEKKYFIPCYNYQNGYYSSSLELQVSIGNVKTTFDISEMVDSSHVN